MTRRTAEDRKTEIVAATLRLADELGPDRLTTQAIADAVGLTQPAIFRHFPSKHALWQAVAIAITEAMNAAWADVLTDQADPERRLTGLVQAQLRHIEASPAIPAILHSRELRTENAELRGSFQALMSHFRKLLLAELTRGRDAGLFRADLAPEDAAVLLISLVQGAAIRWALGDRAFSLRTEGERLLEVQMRLFRAEPRQERRS